MGSGAWKQQPELSFLPSYFSFIAFLHFITAAKVYIPPVEDSDIYNSIPCVITSIIKTNDSETFYQSCK